MIYGIITLLSPAIVTDKCVVISYLYLKVISDNKKACFILKREVCGLLLFRHGLHGFHGFKRLDRLLKTVLIRVIRA